MKRVLPSDITSYDLLKTFAVITMIIDHVGVYFFPDDMWWRTIGRLSFPVWLFLIGYARSRDISPRLIAGAVILFASNIIFGMGLFPLNILFSIILVRLVLDRTMDFMLTTKVRFWASAVLLLIVAIPTFMAVEYGTQALLAAALGYLMRNRAQIDERSTIQEYTFFTLIGFTGLQALAYGLHGAQIFVLALGMCLLWVIFWHFRLETYPAATRRLGPLSGLIKLGGRRTLEIYVLHLILFKVMAIAMGLEGYGWFQWHWMN